jgi:hypothetical protein
MNWRNCATQDEDPGNTRKYVAEHLLAQEAVFEKSMEEKPYWFGESVPEDYVKARND